MVKISIVIRALERNLSMTGFDATDIYFDKEEEEFLFLFQKTYNQKDGDSFEDGFAYFKNNHRFIPFDIKVDCNEIIRSFIATISDQELVKHFNETLHEKNGICKFKETLRALNIMGDYQDFKYNIYKDTAIKWCKDSDIEFTDE